MNPLIRLFLLASAFTLGACTTVEKTPSTTQTTVTEETHMHPAATTTTETRSMRSY